MSRVAIVGGGMAGLETAVALTADPKMNIEVIERGPSVRTDHVDWDALPCPDDEKIKGWVGDGWGDGGGLYEGLGGRSRYYHGVMLPIADEVLRDWPLSLAATLQGADGAYARITRRLVEQYPEMEGILPQALQDRGFRHVPQAAYVEAHTGRFRAYSPLQDALRLIQTSDAFTLIKGGVQKLIAQSDGRWSVEMVSEQGARQVRNNFDVCVPGASAIGNVKILAQTVEREVHTTITDHLSIGALVRLAAGDMLGEFRHHRLWTGYLPLPELGANIFLGERQSLANGERVLDINAVIEQGSNVGDYSELVATPEVSGEASATIMPRISSQDKNRIRLVSDEIDRVIAQAAGGKKLTRVDTKERDYDACEQIIRCSQSSNLVTPYAFPYGAFEHESCTMPAADSGFLSVNEAFEVAGLPNVFAVGPGSFTRSGAANPSLTILATSRIVAQTIHDKYS